MQFKWSILVLLLASCNMSDTGGKPFTEKEILGRLDMARNGTPAPDYPKGNEGDVKYNFFLDLEHGYRVTAGSRIHLYADSTRWAIVFESSGYYNREFAAEIELNYVGNCISYPIDQYPGHHNYITNSSRIFLISSDEYERIRNKEGQDMEVFELISDSATEVNVHHKKIAIEHDTAKYITHGIKLRPEANPHHLIGYDNLLRYILETTPDVLYATDGEIRQHIPADLPELMTIDKFHYISNYDDNGFPPSLQEAYQLAAKILVTRDTSFWKPTSKPNNHWSNWTSGDL